MNPDSGMRKGRERKLAVVCHEDRVEARVGLQLLIASLHRWSPELDVIVSGTDLNELPVDHEGAGQVLPYGGEGLSGRSWNVKPTALLEVLGYGYERVVWFDSDIVVTGDPAADFDGLAENVLVVAEEHPWAARAAGSVRTQRWGLEVGRVLPVTTNSCVVSVTTHHKPLLREWERLLNTAEYGASQRMDIYERPTHMVGDQDVLMSLVGSQAFADVPLKFLRNGLEIVQLFGASGFRMRDRLRHRGGRLPMLIHSQAGRPWRHGYKGRLWPLRDYYQQINYELSSYTWVARQYRDVIEEDDREWLDVRTLPGKLMRKMAGDDPALQGLPMAMLEAMVRRFKRITGLSPWRDTGWGERAGEKSGMEQVEA